MLKENPRFTDAWVRLAGLFEGDGQNTKAEEAYRTAIKTAPSLAPGFATHVSASGVLEDVRAEGALWNLPLMATMLTLMAIVVAWFTAPTDRFASRFVLGGALLVQFVTWVALIRIL